MSDLIERLRREGYTIGGWDEALSELEARQAEIARLRGLVGRLRHVETYEVHTGYDNGRGGGNYVYEPAVLMSDDVIRDLLAALEQKP